MNDTVPLPDGIPEPTDSTQTAPMQITDVRPAQEFGGWIVSANKLRSRWIDAVAAAPGYELGTVYPNGNGVTILIREADE